MVFNAIESVLSLTVLIMVGFFLYKMPWFGETGTNIISKFVGRIAIPCYMCYNVYTTCQPRSQLLEVLRSLPISLGSFLITMLFSLILVKIFHIEKKRQGVFINSCTFCNVVIVGFPVAQALFGPEVLPQAMVYYMGNTILFWSIGVYFLRRDSGEEVQFFSLSNLKQIFSPVINLFLFGCLLVLLQLSIPQFLFTPLEMISKTTTPLAMIFIGCVIRSTDFKSVKFSRELIVILFSRFLLSPALMLVLCLTLPIPPHAKMVFFVFSTMPAMTQLGIMSKECGSDYQFASAVIALTTILSMLFIPLYMAFVQYSHLFS